MRARVLLLLVLGVLVGLAVPPPAAGHAASACQPFVGTPSAGGWLVEPGRVLSFYLPQNQFVVVLALGPVDVSMYDHASCAANEACHEHALVGFVRCATEALAAVEIVNRGTDRAPVFLTVGVCDPDAVC